MLVRSLSVLALVLSPVVARAADEENPYKTAKTGDYAVYVMKSKFGDATMMPAHPQTTGHPGAAHRPTEMP